MLSLTVRFILFTAGFHTIKRIGQRENDGAKVRWAAWASVLFLLLCVKLIRLLLILCSIIVLTFVSFAPYSMILLFVDLAIHFIPQTALLC
jgi:hypothetical protein